MSLINAWPWNVERLAGKKGGFLYFCGGGGGSGGGRNTASCVQPKEEPKTLAKAHSGVQKSVQKIQGYDHESRERRERRPQQVFFPFPMYSRFWRSLFCCSFFALGKDPDLLQGLDLPPPHLPRAAHRSAVQRGRRASGAAAHCCSRPKSP